jgi:XTP/dITP diphosphohydrolase
VTQRVIVVATRSDHKLREIRQLVPPIAGIRLVDLGEAGIAWTPEEETIEAFETFEENALAKARFFHERSGLAVMADDSGLCVDALGGAPGVYSKRFSGRTDLLGQALDDANNRHLLESLAGTAADRSARYVCVIATIAADGTESLFRGTVEGAIAREPRGDQGFGYDPLFVIPDLGVSFGQLPAETKNAMSHRFDAVRKAVPWLEGLAKQA